MADPAQRQLVLGMALTVNVGSERKEDWQNDVDNFVSIKSVGLEQIQCPVLLIHGDADKGGHHSSAYLAISSSYTNGVSSWNFKDKFTSSK